MTRLTVDLLRKKAEHNDGNLSSLEELALHQQNIEKIELIGQLCPHIKILYLQNNLIGHIENLNKLKALEVLNLALNNIRHVSNLDRCESLAKLDLTMNFIETRHLHTVSNLGGLVHFTDLYLLGNPCSEWEFYRPYIIAMLPRLKRLDGSDITISERLAAQRSLPLMKSKLHIQLDCHPIGGSIETTTTDEIAETGTVDENGVLKRPWCPETRILDHMEAEREKLASQKKNATRKQNNTRDTKPRRQSFPEIVEGQTVQQKNEGDWDFILNETRDGLSVVLDIALSPYLDISLIKTDIQAEYVRVLVKGRLLQLRLPSRVVADFSKAERSLTTGHLVITMPKDIPTETPNALYLRPSKTSPFPVSTPGTKHSKSMKERMLNGELIKEIRTVVATVVVSRDDESEDYIPPL